jgi:hypothetical protein
MGRIGIALVFAFFCTAPLASAQKAIDITPYYIAGITLGMSPAKASSYVGDPARLDRLENGYSRLAATHRRLEVYFKTGVKGVVEVTTWNRTLQTEQEIGPCAPLAALRKTYGRRLVPFRQGGKLVAYRLGNLIFTVAGTRVGVVALGRGSAAVFVALNDPACR